MSTDGLTLSHGRDSSIYNSDLGLFGVTLEDQGICATAVGPGGAITLANRDGQVTNFQDEWNPAASSCPITVIDGGVVGSGDTASLRKVDAATWSGRRQSSSRHNAHGCHDGCSS